MSSQEKICILCGQSCAGQARIKNGKGQYAHQSCAQAKQASKQDAAPVEQSAISSGSLYEVDAYNDAFGGGMEDLLGDLDHQDEVVSSTSACPGCGHRMNDGAVVCLSCGFNTASGKAMSTKSKEVKIGPSVGGAALGGVAKVGGVAAAPLLPLIGALIGGAIGAVIWAAIAYFTGYEVGFVAWGVGLLVGVGAAIGAKGEGGAFTGAMAAVISMGAIIGGKYVASYMYAHGGLNGYAVSGTQVEDVDDEWTLSKFAFDHTQRRIDLGETLSWEPTQFIESAYWPDDYPDAVRLETMRRWKRMNKVEKLAFRQSILDDLQSESNNMDDEWDGYLQTTIEDIDDEWVYEELSMDICYEQLAAGTLIDWPDPNLPHGSVVWPEGYPTDVQTQVQSQWDSMSDSERDDLRMVIVSSMRDIQSSIDDASNETTNEIFIQSFKHPVSVIAMCLAVLTAFKVAGNED